MKITQKIESKHFIECLAEKLTYAIPLNYCVAEVPSLDDCSNRSDIFEYKAVYRWAEVVIDISPLPVILLYFLTSIPWSIDITTDT